MLKFLTLICSTFFISGIYAQTHGLNKSVLLSASVQNNPPQITISWQAISDATSFNIYRKTKTATAWGTAIATGLPGTSTAWTDVNVQPGDAYEYKVEELGATYGEGYIYAGIEVPEIFYRGKLLLVYDTISTVTINAEINRWISDAEGDGWEVIEIRVNQNDPVSDVKSKIVNTYNSHSEVKSIFIFGRVPIPYSGLIAPDGHTPDHLGAWPADGYYADINGNWTDVSVNNTGATQARNHNVPGDGKFDQNTFPGTLELQIGRVDMRNLPAFTLSEAQLLKRYLDKNHAYRNKHFTTINRGIIDDNFTSYTEGFSASAWRSFGAVCGYTNIATTDYFTTLNSNNYQWAYGCGAGSYTNCSGIGSTTNFSTDSLRSIFTMLFGSYFGDWDSPSNNLLRAAIANGSTLANCWSGRPFWQFHHMGLGENIGYSAIISMNNISTYSANNSLRGVHMALMGDPTLRNDIVAPAQNLTATYISGNALLTWTASPDAILGYNIYRRNDTIQHYEKINTQLVTSTTFTDTCLIYPGIYKYMVRAVKLENTNSGTYYNMSTGITDTLYNPNYNPIIADFTFSQTGNQITLTNNSQNANTYFWDFGDGNNSSQPNPTHAYGTNGNYTITLIASSNCGSDTTTLQVNIAVGLNELLLSQISIYPNPLQGILNLEINSADNYTDYNCRVLDITGKTLNTFNIQSNKKIIDLTKYAEGIYYIELSHGNYTCVKPIIIIK
jgi:hypothetical protein